MPLIPPQAFCGLLKMPTLTCSRLAPAPPTGLGLLLLILGIVSPFTVSALAQDSNSK